jgi:hypothetical protein
MNKRLEELLERVPQWPEGAQQDAVAVLADIEGRIVQTGELSAEDQLKLAALREMVQNSIAEGGDYSDADIGAMIDELVAKSPFKGR